jgi:protoporphyrinogen oxidase
MSDTHVVILGGGPAGLGAAYRLRCSGRARATVLERGEVLGGNAGSFEWDGQRLDYGSHRLHSACDERILKDIRQLLGDDLLDRPRHGRIRLLGKWIHFPLKPVDLFLRLDKSFAVGSAWDMVYKPSTNGADTFASVLRANLGKTICSHFYFPYARKIWGREPEELSGIQARRRVSAGSFLKLVKKVMGQVPGFKKKGAGRFFYPAQNFGQISDVYGAAAAREGAEIRLNTTVEALHRPADEGSWRISVSSNGQSEELTADHVWSTLPLPLLVKMLQPAAPAELLTITEQLHYRSMLLVYLRLPVEQFTPFDAHYFPEEATVITRLSEPKNYVGAGHPQSFTTLCAELPCALEDSYWSMTDAELGELVASDLSRAGIPLPVQPSKVLVKRLSHAYPIYLNGYEGPFADLDQYVREIPRVLSYGRQGLFAHDNTHHALAMAYAAVDCLGDDGQFSSERWAGYRKVFETHVVED